MSMENITLVADELDNYRGVGAPEDHTYNAQPFKVAKRRWHSQGRRKTTTGKAWYGIAQGGGAGLTMAAVAGLGFGVCTFTLVFIFGCTCGKCKRDHSPNEHSGTWSIRYHVENSESDDLFDEFSVDVRRWSQSSGANNRKAVTGISGDAGRLLGGGECSEVTDISVDEGRLTCDLESKAVTEISVDTELFLGGEKSNKVNGIPVNEGRLLGAC
ncbi:hypothetical protein DPMN_042666 [Dreissena polymorpha]|uniref:Uncharacterized protein n=1 Tax=Dreissena polymorpha TaxID=45954 RepID=A0A9D4HUY0_DREPO|nr:hypothetical protein DPMN_042666 [Dreissena polymorpha]